MMENSQVIPTVSDRQIFSEVPFDKGRLYTSGNVGRRKYDRLENIGWVKGVVTNISDVEYQLTLAGRLQLALIEEAGAAQFGRFHGKPKSIRFSRRNQAPHGRRRFFSLGSDAEGTTMNDETARTARLMNVAEAAVAEFDRQGVAEALANLGFDPVALARVVIKAADGDVIDLSSRRDR
jgi:hypothetical protein